MFFLIFIIKILLLHLHLQHNLEITTTTISIAFFEFWHQQQQNFNRFINCFSTETTSPSFLLSLSDPSAALDSAAADSIKIAFFLSFTAKGIEIRSPFNEIVGRQTCTLETDTQQHSSKKLR